MNAITSTTGIPISVVCAVPIFVVLFIVILMALKQVSMFDKPTAVVVALCTALLCMIGMYRMVVAPKNSAVAAPRDPQPLLDTILLPYAAMALALLLTLLFLLLSKALGGRERIDRRPDLARWREDLAAFRESPGREALNSASRGLPRTPEKGKSGPYECADRLKKIRTDLQNKETMK